MLSPHLFRAALRTGFIVGCMDAVAASVYSFALSGAMPDRVFKYVASGVFGAEAFTGGLGIAAAGLFFHFIVATGWTVLFYLLFPQASFFSSNKISAGVGYGVFIWLTMNFIVIPLSNVPGPGFHFTWRSLIMLGIHMFVIGMPISILANRDFERK